MLKLVMFFLSPYYAWKTRNDSIKKMNLRSRAEILYKRKEMEGKYLMAEKVGNEKDKLKFSYFLTILKWVVNEQV